MKLNSVNKNFVHVSSSEQTLLICKLQIKQQWKEHNILFNIYILFYLWLAIKQCSYSEEHWYNFKILDLIISPIIYVDKVSGS